jgi:transposase
MAKDQQETRRKLRILDHAAKSGDVSKTCRYFGIGRASFYRWRHAYADHGEIGLTNKRSVPHNHPNKTSDAVAKKVLHLRKEYHLGPIRIVWYIERYQGLTISDAGGYPLASRRLCNNRREADAQKQWCEPVAGRHACAQNPHQTVQQTSSRCPQRLGFKPREGGHQIQMDDKFLTFIDKSGAKTRRFQYTAIDPSRACSAYPAGQRTPLAFAH